MKLLFDQNLSRHLVRQLAFLNGPPPKAVWLRLGNASTSEILTSLVDNRDVMRVFSESEDEALLIITPDEIP